MVGGNFKLLRCYQGFTCVANNDSSGFSLQELNSTTEAKRVSEPAARVLAAPNPPPSGDVVVGKFWPWADEEPSGRSNAQDTTPWKPCSA